LTTLIQRSRFVGRSRICANLNFRGLLTYDRSDMQTAASEEATACGPSSRPGNDLDLTNNAAACLDPAGLSPNPNAASRGRQVVY